jgi:Ca2+-transporting ATPase
MMQSWHSFTSDSLARELGSSLDYGLTQAEAERRLASAGPNELPEALPPSPLKILLAQFSSLITWVLLGAAVVSGLLQERVDAAAILTIVLLNALLGFVQEYRAEQSIAALKKLSITMARVIREGVTRSIPARELVPGDLIPIEAGDRVASDSRVVYATGLQTYCCAIAKPGSREAATSSRSRMRSARRLRPPISALRCKRSESSG